MEISLDIGMVYAMVAMVCAFITLLILNRVVVVHHGETIDKDFVFLLSFFILFNIVDACWGMADAGLSFVTRGFYLAAIYAYHIMAGLAAFLWVLYITLYSRSSNKSRFWLILLATILLAVQFGVLFVNIRTGLVFTVDDRLNYHMGVFRNDMYWIQFIYYLIVMGYSCVKFKKRPEMKRLCKSILALSLIPACFCMLQMAFYEAPFYSMGFLCSAFAIYGFNVTIHREEFLYGQTVQAKNEAHIDATTDVWNRRAYEDDLLEIGVLPQKENFILGVFDINDLKVTNDRFGHEAGDQLIRGIADCLRMTFADVGKVFRTGGDEFSVMFVTDTENFEERKARLQKNIDRWNRDRKYFLSVSAGYARAKDFPGQTIMQLADAADQKMYRQKQEYHSKHNIDQEMQNEAFELLQNSFAKILRVNLTKDTFSVLKMSGEDENLTLENQNSITDWLRAFAISGRIYYKDRTNYLEGTDLEHLKEYFKKGGRDYSLVYRRKEGNDYSKCVMEIIPTREYSNRNQEVFLFIKTIEGDE